MITRVKDFTYCHKDIKPALKLGLDIKCLCWDSSETLTTEDWITGYIDGDEFPYFGEKDNHKHAKPL